MDEVGEVDVLLYVGTGLRLVRLTSLRKLTKLINFFKTEKFIISSLYINLD